MGNVNDLFPEEYWPDLRELVHQKASADVDVLLEDLDAARRGFVRYVMGISRRVNQRSLGELEKASGHALELANASRSEDAWQRFRLSHPDGRSGYDRKVLRWAFKELRKGRNANE